jgi:aryl-alcohol dehydrogenase-like predicted oxidoreductase
MTIARVKLSHTDLEVSCFCFGTTTFGKLLDQAGSTLLVRRA